MTADKKSSVEEKIDQISGEVEATLEGTRELIEQAESSMERARQALGEGYGKLRTRSTEAYEKAKEYLAEARTSLDAARVRIGELYGRSREVGEEMYEKAKVQLDRLSVEVKRGYARIKAKVEEVDLKEARDNAIEYIRRNPGKSILMAVAAGFAIGYMVRRREV